MRDFLGLGLDFLTTHGVAMRGCVGYFTRTRLIGAALGPSSVRIAIRSDIVLVYRTRRSSLQQFDKLLKKHATFLKENYISNRRRVHVLDDCLEV